MNEAGRSAQRRYERQRKRLDESLPAGRVARFLTKLGPTYERRLRSAEHWGKGAEGERLTAKALQPLEADGWVLLNDLPLPGSKLANIDHVLIGPPGVFVIETKNYKGRGKVERNRLLINGRDRKKDLDEVWREAAAIQTLFAAELARLALDAKPVICIHNTQLEGGWFREPEIDGVRIGSPRKLVDWLVKLPPKLTAEHVESLAVKLAAPSDAKGRPASRGPLDRAKAPSDAEWS
jgi:hypothetical protein